MRRAVMPRGRQQARVVGEVEALHERRDNPRLRMVFGGFPKTHAIGELLTLVQQSGIDVPSPIRESALLTDYAVVTRYPGSAEDVTRAQYDQAVALAERVVRWADEVIAGGSGKRPS